MFSGAPGQTPGSGEFREGIQSIAVNTMIRQTEWPPLPPGEPLFTDALWALFDTRLVFTLNGGENTMSVYYVLYAREIDIDDEPAEEDLRYQLVGHREIRSAYKGKVLPSKLCFGRNQRCGPRIEARN